MSLNVSCTIEYLQECAEYVRKDIIMTWSVQIGETAGQMSLGQIC